jgi:hypothetical protein
LSPLSLGTSLTLTLSVRVRSVPVKPSFSAVKVPMLAMMISPFGLNKVAPVRPCCDPSGGDGLAAPRSGRNTVENLEAKRICPARNARSAGEIVFAGRLRP